MTVTLQTWDVVSEMTCLADRSAIQHAHMRARTELGKQIVDCIIRSGADVSEISIGTHQRTMDDGSLRIAYVAEVEPDYPPAYRQGFSVGQTFKSPPDLGRYNPAREDKNPYPKSDPRRSHWLAGYQDGMTEKLVGRAPATEFEGLQALVNTGVIDADTGTPCPPIESVVQ